MSSNYSTAPLDKQIINTYLSDDQQAALNHIDQVTASLLDYAKQQLIKTASAEAERIADSPGASPDIIPATPQPDPLKSRKITAAWDTHDKQAIRREGAALDQLPTAAPVKLTELDIGIGAYCNPAKVECGSKDFGVSVDGKVQFYLCNKPQDCLYCRQLQVRKLRALLEDIALYGHINSDGEPAYSTPQKLSVDHYHTPICGNGFWYGAIIPAAERRAYLRAYAEARPGGYPQPEIYPIDINGESYLLIFSLAEYEGMKPLLLTDKLLERIVCGSQGEVGKRRAKLLFAPSRRNLRAALPRYDYEIPKYLVERFDIESVSVPLGLILGRHVKDIHRPPEPEEFGSIAEYVEYLREIGEQSDYYTVINDGTCFELLPQYTITTAEIVPSAVADHLYSLNNSTSELFKRQYTAKAISKSDVYMALGDEPEFTDPYPADGAEYHARIEAMLRDN